jgi:hypothetical protein
MRRDGTHHLWTGTLDERGRPIVYTATRHRILAHRPTWATYWGITPAQLRGRRLMNVCGVALCMSPRHWILSNPESVYKALKWTRWMRRAHRLSFVSRGLSVASGAWWKVALVDEPGFAPPAMLVKAMSATQVIPPLAVMALWSERVRNDIQQSKPIIPMREDR